MSILESKNLAKSFDGVQILKDINLSVEKGEVVVILGSSGSGKSTLLRCACLLENIDRGELKFDDLLITKDNGKKAIYTDKITLKKAILKFGLVFQHFNLFPHFSVLKNITDPLIHIQNISKQKANEIAKNLLQKVSLTHRMNAYPCELSGGQAQRVAIARALALKPDILFFDEPTSALDPEITADILKIIKDLAKEKMTMVIVTHEIEFARNVADRIIFMDKGVIVESGTVNLVLDNPTHKRTKLFLQKLEN